MRYMMLVRNVAPPGPPPAAFLAAMGKMTAESAGNGTLLGGGEFGGADASARVRLAGNKIEVSDGPFPEAKEVIGGYAILEYADKEAALTGCAEFLELHRQNWPAWEGEIEMRPILDHQQRATSGGKQ
jgi:hypothetical protein